VALSNIGREPRREIIEQVAGLAFMLAYVGWVIVAVHLSSILYHPLYCPVGMRPCTDAQAVWRYWADPGDFFITLGLSLGIWLLYPFLLLMHAFGEMVCGWLTALGADPRPKQRYR
jgi:hypothetical protein